MTKTLDDLYTYFDQLVDQDDADLLFASSYLRGFITLASADFDSAKDALTAELAAQIDEQLMAAKNELNPQDQTLIKQFWQQLKADFIK